MRRLIATVPGGPTATMVASAATVLLVAWIAPAAAQQGTLTVADLYDPVDRIDVGAARHGARGWTTTTTSNGRDPAAAAARSPASMR